MPDFAYAGEVALGVVLADPTGELSELHKATATYPPELGKAVVGRLWEASFLLDVARQALPRARTRPTLPGACSESWPYAPTRCTGTPGGG
ncbi:MAG TPA: hypothetical protein VHI11_08320 [Jiangellaceae bacterium]|nr:hypothetical protein [Jiangellaceae bacterium]